MRSFCKTNARMSDTQKKVVRIAMWSGPRNISTAMMRAWENRPDTVVVDEPFYACYLATSEVRHPMQAEVLASQSSDWQTVIERELGAELPDARTIQYQKHMTHHMVAAIDSNWFASVRHAFLIRHPAEVVASYAAKREQVSAEDIGFVQQKKIYELACKVSAQELPIVDARDVLTDPGVFLAKLCACLNVPFYASMLNWPSGPRATDGAWAPHWYASVEKSTGFARHQEKEIELTDQQQRVVDECLPFYQEMYTRRLRLDSD